MQMKVKSSGWRSSIRKNVYNTTRFQPTNQQHTYFLLNRHLQTVTNFLNEVTGQDQPFSSDFPK